MYHLQQRTGKKQKNELNKKGTGRGVGESPMGEVFEHNKVLKQWRIAKNRIGKSVTRGRGEKPRDGGV